MFGSQNAYGGYSNSYGNAQAPTTYHYNNSHSSSANSDPSFGKNQQQHLTQNSRVNTPPSNFNNNHDSSAYSAQHHGRNDRSNLESSDQAAIESGLSSLSIETRKNSNQNDEFPSISGGSFASRASKPSSWASVASQPVKSQPKLLKTKMAVAQGLLSGTNSKHLPPTVTMGAMSWDSKNCSKVPPPAASPPIDAKPVLDAASDASEDERSSYASNEVNHSQQVQKRDYPSEPMAPPPNEPMPMRREPVRDQYQDRDSQMNGYYQNSKPAPPPSANQYRLRPYDPSADTRERDDNFGGNRQDSYYPRQQRDSYPRDNYNRQPQYRDYDNHHQQQQQQYHQHHQQQQRYDMPPSHNYERQNSNNSNNNYNNSVSQHNQHHQRHHEMVAERDRMATCSASPGSVKSSESADTSGTHPVLEKLICENNYNPEKFDLQTNGARFFIIKSFSEDDVHRSIKYSIWCSTEHGNKRLDDAFQCQENVGPIYLFFSVNRSGHFCGVAEMVSKVDYRSSSGVWSQDKWKGQFKVRWVYVKDVPNDVLRHITLENNENKPVTNSRDTQEVPMRQGKEVVSIIHQFKHSTSIFDDFPHYEQKQEKEVRPGHSERPVQEDDMMMNNHNERRRASSPPPMDNSYGRDRPRDQMNQGQNQNYGGDRGYGPRDRDYNRGPQNGYNNGQNNRRNYGDRGDYRNDYGRNDNGGRGGDYGGGRGDYPNNGPRRNGNDGGYQDRDGYRDRGYNNSNGAGKRDYNLRQDFSRQPRNDHFRRSENGSAGSDRDSWRN